MRFEAWYILLGALMLAVTFLDRWVRRLPITTTIVYLACGLVLGPLGFGIATLDPIDTASATSLPRDPKIVVGTLPNGIRYYVRRNDKPEKRAEIDREGFITSGDVGYIDADGYVFICDRKRDMVISGGVNIYPAEIESVLITMPGVKDCAVFGIPDEEFGESLCAYIEPDDMARAPLPASSKVADP